MTSTNTLSKKSRMAYLDLFRLIAATAVVIIHLTASAIGKYQQGSTHQLIVTFINGAALFAVPAFIFASAYTFMVVYKGKTIALGSFFKKRVATLFVPYLAWSFVYYLIQVKISSQPLSIVSFGKCILLGTAFYHLYFMPIIFQYYLLFIPLKWLTEHLSGKLLFIITLVTYYIYTAGLPFAGQFEFLQTINQVLPLKVDFAMSDRLFMSYLPFYMLGMILGNHAECFAASLKKWAPFMIIFYFATTFFHVANRIAYYVYQNSFPIVLPYAWELSAIAAILMILWLTQIFEPKYSTNKHIPVLSGYTFDLYLAHPLVLFLGEYALKSIGIQSTTLILICLTIAGISLPLLYAHIKKLLHIPYL